VRILILTELELPRGFDEELTGYLGIPVDVNIQVEDMEGLKSLFRDRDRSQIRADLLLNYLESRRILGRYSSFDKFVIVINDDAYVPNLNFVFGVAKPSGRFALVFTKRLIGDSLHVRILKEIIHELGHTMGLNHCGNPRCVMYFSSSVIDTDNKGPGFCEKCRTALRLRRASTEA